MGNLRAPLQVVLTTAVSSYSLGPRLLEDVQYGSNAPGGFTTARVSLASPLTIPKDELRAYATLAVYDTRTGEQTWFGRLEDPGKGSGDVWVLAAVGPKSHASDLTKGVVYNDARMDQWVQTSKRQMGGAGQATVQADETDPDDPSLELSIARGTTLPASALVATRYELLRATGQTLGRVIARVTAGVTTASWRNDIVGRGGPAADAVPASATWNTVESTLNAVRTTHITTDHRIAEVRMLWLGAAGTVAGNDLNWVDWRGLRVMGTRVDRQGVTLVAAGDYTGPSSSSLYPHQVVEDVLGRFLPEFDRSRARVDTSSVVPITQMAYEDGADAETILGDLMGLAPTHAWFAWGETVPGAGATFEWSPWPTTVSLEGLNTDVDEFDYSGSAADLYNEVTVRYKMGNGRTQSVVVTGDCPDLTRAGLVRRGLLDLGSQLGDKAQAQAAGANFLAAHKYPANGGTIKVRRPIWDRASGRSLHPWQIRAGGLCRVGNLYPQIDYLNPTPDGSTVFRVSGVSYSAKSNEATLTLDSYDRTLARALAALSRSAARQRRL